MQFSPILSNSRAGRFANRGADVAACSRCEGCEDARMLLDSAPEMVGVSKHPPSVRRGVW